MVDDNSTANTVKVARSIGIRHILKHENYNINDTGPFIVGKEYRIKTQGKIRSVWGYC